MDELQRVLLRLSETEDEKLGTILDKLLPRLLKILRTSSDSAKLVEIINLALTRCKAYSAPLPLIALAQEFFLPNEPSPSETLFRHLTVIFLDLGATNGNNALEQYSSFLLKSNAFTQDPKFAVSFFLQSMAGLQPTEHLTLPWARLCEEFLLIPAGCGNAPFVPGLSSERWTLWRGKVQKWDKNAMIERKMRILECCEPAPTPIVYTLFLAATCEPYDQVNERGQTLTARREGAIEVGVPFLENLIRFAQRANAPAKIRTKVLQLLARNPVTGLEVAESLEFVVANLKSAEHVQQAALSYLRSLSALELPSVATVRLLQALEGSFWANGVLDLSGEAPEALKLYGALAKNQPAAHALATAPTIFSLLTDYQDGATYILEALSGILHSLSIAQEYQGSVAHMVRPWLQSPQPMLRREALRWTLHLLQPEDARYHLSALRYAHDVDAEIRGMCDKALEKRQMPTLAEFVDALVEQNIVTVDGKLAGQGTPFWARLMKFITCRSIQPEDYRIDDFSGPHVRFVRLLLSLGDYFLVQKEVDRAIDAFSFVSSIDFGARVGGVEVWPPRFEAILRSVVDSKSFPLAQLLQKMNLNRPNAQAFQDAVDNRHILAIGALCTAETESIARPLLQDSLKSDRTNASEYLDALRLLKAFSSVHVEIDDSLLHLAAELSHKDNERAFAAVQLLPHEKVIEVSKREHWKNREDAQCACALALDPVAMLQKPLEDGMWAPVWACCFLKRLVERMNTETNVLSSTMVEDLARLFARGISGLSLFIADCSIKGLVRLWMLQPPDLKELVVKAVITSSSQRTQVDNMFVAKVKEKEAKDSMDAAAKERIEGMKELIFLSRELGHIPLLIALLDQPTASSSGGICQKAVDVQALCIPVKMRNEVCPAKLLPKLPPYFYHTSDTLRSKVVSLCANYFSIEQAPHCGKWDEVYSNLVQTLGASRVSQREASILCASQVLRSRSWQELKEHFEPLWVISVKLMDDLEKRVQAIVLPFIRVLRGLTIRLCDGNPGSGTKPADAAEAMHAVLPLLMKFVDTYKHAQPLCFDVLREIAKSARTDVLAPYLCKLVPMLLISLSAMEYEGLEYYQQHVDNPAVAEQFEKARVYLSHSSPSHDLLHRMVRFIEHKELAELHSQLVWQLRHGVGAHTRCGVCDLYEWIASEKGREVFGSLGPAVLKALASGLFDTSAIVRAKAASAFASLARKLEDSSALQKVIQNKLLQDDSSTSFREASAKALMDIGRRCDVRAMNLDKDVLGKLASRAFLLKHNDDGRVQTMWEEVWSEYALPLSSTHPYIIDALVQALDSQERRDRICAAKAAVELVGGLAEAENDSLTRLSTALQHSLSNWKGIGPMVKAVAEVALKVYALTSDRAQAVSALDQCLLYAKKGHRDDRQLACQSVLVLIQKGFHTEIGYEGAHDIYTINYEHINEREKEIALERIDQLVDPHLPKVRGRPSGDEFFIPIFDIYAEMFESAKEMEDDENDVGPPDSDVITAYLQVWLFEFLRGALALRLALLRALGRIFRHFKTIKVAPKLHQDVMDQIIASWADERIRIRVASFETLAAAWDIGWFLDDGKLQTLMLDLQEDVKSEIDSRTLERFLHHLREVAG